MTCKLILLLKPLLSIKFEEVVDKIGPSQWVYVFELWKASDGLLAVLHDSFQHVGLQSSGDGERKPSRNMSESSTFGCLISQIRKPPPIGRDRGAI